MFAVIYSTYNRFIHKRELVVYGIMDLMPKDKQESIADSEEGSLKQDDKIPGKNKDASGTVIKNRSISRKTTKSFFSSFWSYF